MWEWESPIGVICIKRLSGGPKYGMEYDGVIWDVCSTPQEQADNIYMHVTGCSKWDSCGHEAPMDLSGWEKVR